MSKNLIKMPRSQIVEISNILLAPVHSLPNLTLSHHTCQLLLKMKRFKSDIIKMSDENDALCKNSFEFCPNCEGTISPVDKRTLATTENLIILQEMYTLNLIE